MEEFVHRQNLAHDRGLLADTTDEAQRRMPLRLSICLARVGVGSCGLG